MIFFDSTLLPQLSILCTSPLSPDSAKLTHPNKQPSWHCIHHSFMSSQPIHPNPTNNHPRQCTQRIAHSGIMSKQNERNDIRNYFNPLVGYDDPNANAKVDRKPSQSLRYCIANPGSIVACAKANRKPSQPLMHITASPSSMSFANVAQRPSQ
jgi:hypothetical protein